MSQKTPFLRISSAATAAAAAEVEDVDSPCCFPEAEMRTPRAALRSPSEPRTPSKDSGGKPFSLGSPLVTPKLDRRKAKHRSASQAAVAAAAAAAAAGGPKAAPGGPPARAAPSLFAGPGLPQKELAAAAAEVRAANPTLKWCSVEADDGEQLLRRFDMQPMYGPCMGLSREDRWRRAAEMGLEPPAEVLQLLQRRPKSSMSVFDQRLNPDESASL